MNRHGKKWLLQVCYYEPMNHDKDKLQMDSTIYESEDVAIASLNAVIRHDWTTEVDCDGEVKALADCRGKTESSYADLGSWGYSADGRLAWAFFSDGHGYKGEIVPISQ